MPVIDLFHEAWVSARRLGTGLVGWVAVAPIAMLTPRRRDWVAVVGRHGKFIGNTKFFFIHASLALGDGVRVVYVADDEATAEFLRRAGHDCVGIRWWGRTWVLLRAGSIVVDSTDWPWTFFRFTVIGARKVQLWHGVGYKRIGRDKWNREIGGKTLGLIPAALAPAIGDFVQTLNGRRICYDAFNSTSTFYEEQVFKQAMQARHWLIAGYPRNTFGRDCMANDLVWVNIDADIVSAMKTWRTDQRRLVIFAPTFRDSGEPPVPLDAESIAKLDAVGETHGVEFIFKLHVRDRDRMTTEAEHVHACDPDSDIYPILPMTSALVTDYSSIYMDYLWLDRPVLFFVPDLERYQSDNREFQFDFAQMTPGPKAATWDALLAALAGQWDHDDYAAERARLRRLAFDDLPQAEATPKLLDFMCQQGWICPRADSDSIR